MKTIRHIQYTISILLLALWIPSALDKIMDFNGFRLDIYQQPVSDLTAQALVYTIPMLEMAVVTLLVSVRVRWVGFGLSSLLMAVFTGFVAMAWLGAWPKLPCGCGKLIAWMSWQQHFWFNLFFFVISVMALMIDLRMRNKKLHERDHMHGVPTEKENIPSHRLQKE